jgi:hypothetical protein
MTTLTNAGLTPTNCLSPRRFKGFFFAVRSRTAKRTNHQSYQELEVLPGLTFKKYVKSNFVEPQDKTFNTFPNFSYFYLPKNSLYFLKTEASSNESL